jgi:hypothetical protein
MLAEYRHHIYPATVRRAPVVGRSRPNNGGEYCRVAGRPTVTSGRTSIRRRQCREAAEGGPIEALAALGEEPEKSVVQQAGGTARSRDHRYEVGLEWINGRNYRNSERIPQEVEDSLRRLGTDYFGLYQLH